LKLLSLSLFKKRSKVGINSDASYYYWGGYLWQLDENAKEQIILFISGSFTGAQLNWPINEKEMYAVVRIVQKVKYLVGTRAFVIRMDHRNLQFWEKVSASAKVERWKLFLTEFNHSFEFIEGESNVIADAMSRLMSLREVHTALIKEYHNEIAGHFGVDATLKNMNDAGINYSGLRDEIAAVVKSCVSCQVSNVRNKRHHGDTFTLSSSEELESISIDTVGPLNEDIRGAKYIICICDDFSRYVELTATKTAEAEEASEAIYAYICTYGTPKQIRMDNGPQYTSRVNKRLLQLLNVQVLFTTPYSSQENSIVERKFREIRRHLGHLARADRTLPWSSRVKAVQRIMNAQSGSLGVSAADLKFGKPHVLTNNLLVSASPPAAVADPDFVAKLQQMHRELSETIASELKQKSDRKPIIEGQPVFSKGEWVWVEKEIRLKSDVFNAHRDGPFEVETQEGNTVVLKDNRFLREKRVNVSRCTLFNNGDMNPYKAIVEVKTSVLDDDKEYIVEAILDHVPKPPAPVKLQGTKVLVKWLGYEGEDTWEFINGDIRRTPQFAEYARNFPELAKFIPRDIFQNIAAKNSSDLGGGTSKENAGLKDSKPRGAASK